MDVGTELRQAREQAGLSREALAQQTKIQLAKIEALEANAFDRLPEGVYLDGLLRAFATEVGLDGTATVARLHRQRQAAAEEALDEAPPLPQAPDVLAMPLLTPLPDAAADAFIAPAAMPAREPAPSFAFAQPAPAPSRATWVMGLLAVCAAAALGGYIYGERSDSRPPTHASAARTPGEPAAAASTAATPGARSSDRQVDSPEDSPGGAADVAANSGPPTPAWSDQSPAGAGPPNTPSTTTAPPSRTQPAPAPAPEMTADASSALGTHDPAATMPDVSGAWTLDTRVESTSVSDFHGLHLGYQLELQQDGDRVTGRGVKARENGRRISTSAQTPIAVQGIVEGRRVTLTFVEHGTRRDSEGKMILDVYDDGVLRGRFSSTAARSTGTAEARRPQGQEPAPGSLSRR